MRVRTNDGILHYETCRANYPEKPKGEKPRATERIQISQTQIAITCVDCGAHIIKRKEKK